MISGDQMAALRTLAALEYEPHGDGIRARIDPDSMQGVSDCIATCGFNKPKQGAGTSYVFSDGTGHYVHLDPAHISVTARCRVEMKPRDDAMTKFIAARKGDRT